MSGINEQARSFIAASLSKLARNFAPGVKLTLIARTDGDGEADILVGDDYDLDAIIALVERSKAREPQAPMRSDP